MIVDDKPDNRTVLRKLLTPFGFELREATNGQEAVAIWHEWKPHLIWMDLRMPIMGGYEATQRIREAEEELSAPLSPDGNQATIIIALSASTLEEERTVAISKGCHDFLRKPFHEYDLFTLMQTHLGVRFVYGDASEAFSPRKKPTPQTLEDLPSALAALPVELCSQLEHATTISDPGLLKRVIADIFSYNVLLAEILTGVVDDFEYVRILTAVQQSKTLR